MFDSNYFQPYIVQLNRETNLSALNLIFRRFIMFALLAGAVAIKRRFCGVKGTVVAGVEPAPIDPVETLKGQLRTNIMERYGVVHLEEVPPMEPIEVVLPPSLNIAEMAQKRGQLKGVTTIDVHHRAVLKVPADDPQAISDAILHSRHHDVELEIVKGVDVQVIPDDHPVDETPVAAEIVVSGPRAALLSEAARECLGDLTYTDQLEAPLELEVQEFEKADLRFWDNFFARIAQKSHILDQLDDAHLLSLKDKYSKGYHPIREMGTEVYGIVHVTKNSMNALYLTDREAGTFRTVTQTKRFNEATEVGVLEAKAFLNGRY
jgi:hypothetical protein